MNRPAEFPGGLLVDLDAISFVGTMYINSLHSLRFDIIVGQDRMSIELADLLPVNDDKERDAIVIRMREVWRKFKIDVAPGARKLEYLNSDKQ